MKYLIAVKIEANCDVFEFDTEEERARFIEDCKKNGVEYATSEIE